MEKICFSPGLILMSYIQNLKKSSTHILLKTMNILLEQEITSTYKDSRTKEKNISRVMKIIDSRGWDKLNKELLREIAYLVGKVTGDGNLDKSFTVRLIGQKEDVHDIMALINEKLEVPLEKMSIRYKQWLNGTSYVLQINDSTLGRLLYIFGAPLGNKTFNNFLVPNWIYHSNDNEVKRRYLQALLEDELSTIKIEKSSYSNKPFFKMAKNEDKKENLTLFLKQVKDIIEEFDIECSNVSIPKIENIKKSGKNTIYAYFCINRNKSNIIKFKENLGFRINKKKIEKLNKTYDILSKSKSKSRLPH